jgi:hypothetical protein
MLSKIAVLAGLASAVGFGGVARADGVDFTPFGPGGVQWTVSVPGFDTPLNYGTRTASSYDLPFSGSARPGCFALSQWLPVGHADGTGEFLPDFASTWEGILFPRQTLSTPVFTLQVEVRAPSGAVATARKTVTSSLFALEPIYFPTPDSVLYWGVIDSTPSDPDITQHFTVHTSDQIRVSVCDLVAGSSIQVRRLVLRTIPFDN